MRRSGRKLYDWEESAIALLLRLRQMGWATVRADFYMTARNNITTLFRPGELVRIRPIVFGKEVVLKVYHSNLRKTYGRTVRVGERSLCDIRLCKTAPKPVYDFVMAKLRLYEWEP